MLKIKLEFYKINLQDWDLHHLHNNVNFHCLYCRETSNIELVDFMIVIK